MEKRPDVRFVRSTLFDNPFIPDRQKKKILSYEPTPANIEAGTADDYMWAVYGAGKRSAPTGLVYPNVKWIDAFPENVEDMAYGLDFSGGASPSALVKGGRSGNDLFAQLCFYAPTQNAKELETPIKAIVPEGSTVWCDSADPAQIGDLRRMGIRAIGAKKWQGSLAYGIGLVNGYNLHLVNDVDLKREQENYKWREIQGIRLNEPIKEFDHAFDALRYLTVMAFRR